MAEQERQRRSCVPLMAALFVSALAGPVAGDEPSGTIARRPAWATSRIMGSPEPPLPYVTERAFPALQFKECLDITAAPGSDRLFVVQQGGKIFSFPARDDVKQADLAIDLAKEIPGLEHVYALAFHPKFAENRYCYVCYILAANQPDGSHIARFRVADTDPPTIDPASETTILTWLSGGHNGCCLKFGPDGCLYISTGDGSGPNPPDSLRAGQDVSNLLSAILRIDVDHAGDGRNYRIPPDNPFVSLPGARPEIWAYGFRNPWRMSFDRQTGDLWVGDVGWELWELLDRVERGGNYGWSVMEGRQATNPEWPRGPTPILPPTIDHPHSESSSITDGLTYYGQRLKDLHGTHIYGDYDTGKIWGFRYENGRIANHRELADTTHRIVGFGEDHRGECYLLDHTAGTIHRLVPNSVVDRSTAFPQKLSESGLFASVAGHSPAPGVVPYSIHAEPWADHAIAERFVAVPGDGAIQAEKAAWTFPKDSVLVKTLSLDMEHGNRSSRRRVETQLLHFDGSEWQPYTYQWNDEQTDALLVEAGGAERTLAIADRAAPVGTRRQLWRFSGRAECQRCHNKWAGPPLAFNTPQLNKDQDYGGTFVSQLDALAQMGLIAQPIPAKDRPKLADPHDAMADLDARARAYLHTNCAHCHRLHAGSAVLSKMQYDLPLAKTDMVGIRPTQGTFGIHAAQVIAPGDPFRSVLLYRMAKLGGGRMPHIGSSEVDRAGVELIYEWLQQIPADAAPDTAGNEAAAHLRREESAVLERLRRSEKETEQKELVDRLLSSTSGALLLLHRVDQGVLPPAASSLAVDKAARHSDVSIRDLFERFLPAEQRVKRLGSVVQSQQILDLPGDAARGEKLFFQTASVSCKNCHRIGEEGKEVGPDLTTIGKKYDRIQLLESVLEPSRRIDPKYVTYLAETDDGRQISGLLVKQNDSEVVLKDAQNMEIRIPQQQVLRLVPQKQSLMPDLLLRDMTAEQVADLLAYLCSLQ
ncbi:MAG TPA: PQQ-dependent sugar dehydrogenase [Pirellulaceae bacterium]|nr:PQQ-dependent sugar dehydrogenase [Pirellulaceae bacterium]